MTYAHANALLEKYDEVVAAAFSEISFLLRKGPEILAQHLKGPVAHSGFSRLA
jgi:hypothetical protein